VLGLEERTVVPVVVGDLPMESWELVPAQPQPQPRGTQTDHNADFYFMQMFRMDIKNQISFVNIDWTKRVMKEGRSVYFSE
jgi:hypothetical protein